MTPEQYFDLFKLLGVAAPLVWILWTQLRASTVERQDITTKFLATLEGTAKTSAEALVHQAESTNRAAAAMTDMANTIADQSQRHSAEHQRILDYLVEVGKWTPSHHQEERT